MITFRMEYLYVGKSTELGGSGLLTYFHGGAGRGTIVGYIFKGTTVKEVDIDVDFEGKDEKLYDKYFADRKHLKFKVIEAKDLPPQQLFERAKDGSLHQVPQPL
jgi:hypothetical protein